MKHNIADNVRQDALGYFMIGTIAAIMGCAGVMIAAYTVVRVMDWMAR